MSDESIQIRRRLPCEWWPLAGQLRAALDRRRGDPDLRWTSQPASSGCIIHIGPHPLASPIAQFMFVGKDDSTTLVVTTIAHNVPKIQSFIDDLAAMAREARDARRGSVGETPDELIEEYYRRRAAGSKVTLKQLAAQAGISYSYITKAKMKYDRAGKWGSRTSERNSETNS